MRTRIDAPAPGIYPGVPMAEYLAWDAWSRSDVAAMAISPEFCHWHRWEREDDPSPAMEFGTLAHIALLEPHHWPPHDVVWIEGEDWRRNPARAEVQDARERGFNPQKASVRARVDALVRRARQHPYIRHLLDLSDLEREVSAVATCPVTGLTLKARCDLRAPTISVIGDLKTTTVGTDRRSFQRQLRRHDWHLSGPHYVETFGLAEGGEYDTYLFLVVGQDAPFQPRVYHLDPLTMEAGRDYNHMLRRKVVACLESDRWPAGPEEIEPIGLNRWDLEEIQRALSKEAEEQAHG